jgi:hypothetical protein
LVAILFFITNSIAKCQPAAHPLNLIVFGIYVSNTIKIGLAMPGQARGMTGFLSCFPSGGHQFGTLWIKLLSAALFNRPSQVHGQNRTIHDEMLVS